MSLTKPSMGGRQRYGLYKYLAYKVWLLPYPPDTIRWQVAIKLTWFGTQYSRLVLGSMGNKLKMRSPLVWLLLSTSQLLGLGGVSLLQLFCWLLWMQSFVHYSNSSYCQGR